MAHHLIHPSTAAPARAPHWRLILAGLWPLCAALPVWSADQAASLDTVRVQGRADAAQVEIGGFAGTLARELPMQTTVLGEGQRLDIGGVSLADFARLDASVGGAYNATGYWSNLTVRGFSLDLRSNLRRDGLPISGETALPLDNKARLELLKGASGIQAGVSAPGGLVNFIVKRPDTELRSALVEIKGDGNLLAAVDLSSRFGEDRAFGLRLNVAAERLRPRLDDAEGQRRLLALAGDWRIAPGSLLEAEFELSQQRQPSQPGFSLLGDRVPDARDIDPTINLNNQAWVRPIDFEGLTGSLRWTQALAGGWRFVAHGGSQRLKTDDYTAFPYGCGAEGNFDRYCSDGSFDYYDFRSENERRRQHALDLGLHGSLQTGPISHRLSAGLLFNRSRADFEGQAFNYVGIGTINGQTEVPADPTLTDDNTNRRERSREFYLRDQIQLAPGFQLWLGLRHTRLERESISTSGTRATAYEDDFTTPWIAASWTPAPGHSLYASWGRGVESDVTPNRPRYQRRGEAVGPLESRQTEIGWRGGRDALQGGLALFRIDRPVFADLGPCEDSSPGSCSRQADGEAVHQGVEASLDTRLGPWTLGLAATWIHARREGSAQAGLNGSRPVNVPARSLRADLQYRFSSLPGLRAYGLLSADSDRVLIPGDDKLRIPGWARLDLGASYEQRLPGGQRLIWRAGIDNLANRRAWQEGPYQFGHVYLYPLPARSVRASLQLDL
ncbi:TonB-dependent siderophore receptor [Piscinibacter sp. Jin2]|uniref:TonB-dependent siderophore receptor n=1 Tax=Aquariibacter lacus TaxID=2801332 RepID=A0A9X0XEY2_9BURK|nr:TonB-dependent siderophore receptor [Piscinibacter lacus]MBL0719756.1 TonB-dependent siderophore receptor [Piscinibacter lacus]